MLFVMLGHIANRSSVLLQRSCKIYF
uniref:Uncharacterized protein n=1 Tax=Anguilla anguilla TaxID=7936 RepID=A0A0E9TZS3_ANGAN